MDYFLNGEFVKSEDAKLHVSDLGLLRGYGIFDYLRCIGQEPMFSDDHMERFYRSAEHLELEVGMERSKLMDIVQELLSRNPMDSSGIRFILTGGYSSDGYTKEGSNLVITQEHLPVFSGVPEEYGVKLASYHYQRMLPEIKTTNYVIGILKKKWCAARGVNDLLFHLDGWISELPRSNFFIVDKDGVLATPDLGILWGITRKNILKYASEFMEVRERPVHLDELKDAKEAFFTGTGKRIIPVGGVDDVEINSGKTGPVARKLIEIFYSMEDALVK